MAALSFEAAERYVLQRQRFGMRPGLGRMEVLLKRLGHPERRLSVVHIAGTNGKGSTAALLAAALQAAGYRVGLYTSPYIVSFTERICIDGMQMPRDHFAAEVASLQPLVEMIDASALGPMTTFELITAVALDYFSKQHLDVVVLEVGLGGRLDATNVVRPMLSIITNIGHDHMDVLGPTLGQVAYEKAGVVKSGVPLICGVELDEPARVIEAIAHRRHASAYWVHRAYEARMIESTLQGTTVDLTSCFGAIDNLFASLTGSYQVANIAAAAFAVQLLEKEGLERLNEDALRHGFAQVQWPGRFEQLGTDPLVIVDGAHNPEGAMALRTAILSLGEKGPLTLVVGVLEDKMLSPMLDALLPLADWIVATAPASPRALPAQQLAAAIRAKGQRVTATCDRVEEAVAVAYNTLPAGGWMVVTGSLYTVAQARRFCLSKMRKGSRMC
ncbi:MAG: bifunctional folylpolyglutamate synthase/dihydrofolate synthase [Firmicutes bacterium]|nr:bifunctional folylpolyglutamate synthase/dihydrofolate synthase [Bacillota bacterium]